MAIAPEEIGPSAEGDKLRILWQDGAASEYALHELRMSCPCAGCVDEMTGQRILQPAQIPGDIYLTAIHYVGRYALQFVWSDGHDTGLYAYTMLRELSGLSAGDGTP